MNADVAIADAASLVLFAPPARRGDPPPLLMAERAAALAFAGGALVFPGGRVEPSDRTLALELGDAEAAARIAAIRETIEEAGVAVGLDPLPDEDMIAALRAGLRAGEPFGELLSGLAIGLSTDTLTPFARWLTPPGRSRRFDTRFYLAEVPTTSPAVADGEETVATLWIAAADALAAASGGRRLLFPTRRMLERLAALGDFATARADAARWPEAVIETSIEERGGVRWLCVPDGLGYPVTAEPLDRIERG